MKFYELSPQERRNFLEREGYITHNDARLLRLSPLLREYAADGMIENQVGIMGIPIGLLMGLKVNDKEYNVPMATEEPSVVAAACAGAKIARENGGVIAAIWPLRVIPADIVFQRVSAEQQEDFAAKVEDHYKDMVRVMQRPCLTSHTTTEGLKGSRASPYTKGNFGRCAFGSGPEKLWEPI